MWDSTARLVWSDAAHLKLPLQFFSARQRTVQEYDPISCHCQRQLRLITPRLRFRRIREHGTHARMRHVGFDPHADSGDRSGGGIRHAECDGNRTDPRGRWRNFVSDRQIACAIIRSTAPDSQHERDRGNGRHQDTPSPHRQSEPIRGNDQAALGSSFRCQAQVQVARTLSVTGGNMW